MTAQADWASVLLDGLVRAGLTDVVLSPGSRSTPWVLAAAADERLTCHDVLDERSAAFFALGQARVAGRPSALLCTSGTAAAHYLPAIIEASEAGVPLVVLSADRPFELLGCGANQTVDLVKLYGGHVRYFMDVPAADESAAGVRAVRRTAAQAYASALGPRPGPVHLVLRARKPLEPDAGWVRTPAPGAARAEAVTRVHAPASAPTEDAAREIGEACAAAQRGLLLAGPGPLSQVDDAGAVLELARVTGLAVAAEATSQLRLGGLGRDGVAVLDGFDAIYRAKAGRDAMRPDFVLQLGPHPTSTGLDRLLAEGGFQRIVVDPHGWPDPHGTADALVRAAIGTTVRAVLRGLGAGVDPGAEMDRPSTPPGPWAERTRVADGLVWRAVTEELGRCGDTLSEGAIPGVLFESAPRGAIVAVGNSLPVRQLDAWCPGREAGLRVLSQRGASGIDGLISSAAGAADQAGTPVVLWLGDVSFLHDVGGLWAAARARVPLPIVVTDNDGGRIFEQLPLAARDDLAGVMRHFTTPPRVRVAALAEAYGCRHVRVDRVSALGRQVAQACGEPGCTVIEAAVPPGGAAVQARLLWERVEKEMSCLGTGEGA